MLAAEIRPLRYQIEVQRSPLSENPEDKVMIVILPLEIPPVSYVFALSEEQKTHIHDATAPGLRAYAPGDMPPEPPNGL